MDKETALKILRELHDKALFSERTALETLHPELKESEDERVRNELIEFVKSRGGFKQEYIAWIEKQESVGEIVERCKNSWYNEGKIDGMAEGLTNDEKYQQGWHDALEKQGDNNEIAKGILRGAAINLITWIDYNAAEGNMCLSNMECKDIEDALVSGDWDKIYAYIKKKLEKQGEQKPMTEEFEHELAEICNQLLSEIDSEWMNNEILDCIGTSVWLNLCDETAKRYKDGLLKLAKQGEQKPAEWGEEDEEFLSEIISDIKLAQDKHLDSQMNQIIFEEEVTWLIALKERIGG